MKLLVLVSLFFALCSYELLAEGKLGKLRESFREMCNFVKKERANSYKYRRFIRSKYNTGANVLTAFFLGNLGIAYYVANVDMICTDIDMYERIFVYQHI